MELNTNIWGSFDDNSVAYNSNTLIYTSNKAGAENLASYRTTYSMSEPIDESINCWQIADFSMFNSVAFCRRDGNNTPILTECRSTKAKSILLGNGPTSSNMTFNPTQSSNLMWSSDVSNSVYTGTGYKIYPWFDYNKIIAIFQLTTRKFNSDGQAIGSNVNRSIYEYYHDNDSDDLPLTTNWKIIALNVRFAYYRENIQAFQPFSDVHFLSSAEIPFPQPNYYYTSGSYTAYNAPLYQGGVNTLGSQALSSAGGYGSQQGAYGQSNNAFIVGFSSNAWEKKSYLNSSNQLIEYFSCTLNYEEMLRQCSTLGFWFYEDANSTSTSTSYNIQTGTSCTDNKVIMPEIINGRTTGNYKRGAAAAADLQALWGTDWRDNVNYKGDESYKNQGDTGDLTSVFHRLSLGGSLTYYVGTPYAMDSLITTINSGYQPASNDQFVLDFKGTNPADYVCTVMYYPAEFQCPYTAGTFTTIHIGAISPTFPPNLLAQADVEAGYYKEFSPINIMPYFNDFRDYAPYTTISLYVPFCGTVDLDPALFIGHTLIVRLFIDYLTGNCTGVIMRDDTVIDTVSGSCGVSIPLTALNTGSYQNAIKSAEIALKQAEINRKTAWLGAMGALGTTLGGAAMGNPMAIGAGVAGGMGVVTAIQQTTLTKELAEYNLDHIAPAVCNVSAASPCNALGLDYDIHLLIKRCRTVEGFDEGLYSQTVGHACCINDVLGNYSGLTVCSNVKLDSVVSDIVTIGADTFGGNAATADEIALIKQCLNDGVYM